MWPMMVVATDENLVLIIVSRRLKVMFLVHSLVKPLNDSSSLEIYGLVVMVAALRVAKL